MTNPDKTSDSEVKKTLKRKLQDITQAILFLGWEMGKKQHKNPYKFTYDAERGEEYFNQILQAVEKMVKRIVGEQEEMIHPKNAVEAKLINDLGLNDTISAQNLLREIILLKLKKEIYEK